MLNIKTLSVFVITVVLLLVPTTTAFSINKTVEKTVVVPIQADYDIQTGKMTIDSDGYIRYPIDEEVVWNWATYEAYASPEVKGAKLSTYKIPVQSFALTLPFLDGESKVQMICHTSDLYCWLKRNVDRLAKEIDCCNFWISAESYIGTKFTNKIYNSQGDLVNEHQSCCCNLIEPCRVFVHGGTGKSDYKGAYVIKQRRKDVPKMQQQSEGKNDHIVEKRFMDYDVVEETSENGRKRLKITL